MRTRQNICENIIFTIPIYILSSLLAIWLVYGIFRSGRL